MFIKPLVDRFYNEQVEDVCTKVLYFNNTLDTYFLIGAFLSFLVIGSAGPSWPLLLPVVVAIYVCFKISDFYPVFLLFTPLFALALANVDGFDATVAAKLFAANLLVFVVIQFLFMGIPDSIVGRDPTISVRKLYNSIFTIAPTTVSVLMSVYFSTLCALVLYFKPNPLTDGWAVFLWGGLFAAAFVTKRFKPKSFASREFLPPAERRIVDRVVVLNIDGCRLDRFYEAKLPLLDDLRQRATYFEQRRDHRLSGADQSGLRQHPDRHDARGAWRARQQPRPDHRGRGPARHRRHRSVRLDARQALLEAALEHQDRLACPCTACIARTT